MLIYPDEVLINYDWTANPPADIISALRETQTEYYIYNISPANLLKLGMPREVINCQLRAKAFRFGDVPTGDPSDSSYRPLLLEFYRETDLVYSIRLRITGEWEEYRILLHEWDNVVLIAETFTNETIFVDYLRGEPTNPFPTKRTLTGVGI